MKNSGPETHEEQFFNGRNYQEQLDRIRQEQFRLEDIYKRDPELYEWWTRRRNDARTISRYVNYSEPKRRFTWMNDYDLNEKIVIFGDSFASSDGDFAF